MNDLIFFRQATAQICSSLEPPIVLRRCFDFLKEYMPIHGISMMVYDTQIQALRIIAYALDPMFEHMLPPEEQGAHVPIPRDEWDQLMAMEGNVVVVNDPTQDIGGKRVCEATGFCDFSYIVLRVEVGRDIPGHIVIACTGQGAYSAEHARMLELILDPFSIAMTNAIRHQELEQLKDLLSEDNRYLYHELHLHSGDAIIGSDKGLKAVMQTVLSVAQLKSVVMLLGETGVGKEVIANAVHYNSPQADGPFIKINCGAIPENLIDSELFGHEKGAFTGAVSGKRGHFERAHGGTLFLDEIGDLPLSAQVRLLRVLQHKELMRVGGTQSIKVDVRIIAATHHNMKEMVARGEFRKDLWFRLNVLPITIPPLRARKQDIPALVEYFIERKTREMNLRRKPKLSPLALKNLQAYDWPGNVRELENCVERALIQNVIANRQSVLDFAEFGPQAPAVAREAAPALQNMAQEPGQGLSYEEITERHLRRVLETTGGRIHGPDGAAAILQMNPSTLRHRLRKLGIPFGRSKGG